MRANLSGRSSSAYQAMLVILLGLNMGVVFLDRIAFSLLTPMIQPEFALSNTQIGVVGGALAVTWALSSFGLARLADVTGQRKLILLVGTVIFSFASIGSGFAVGVLSLIAARAFMGLAEGGLPPVSMHIVSTEVAPEHRGLALGAMSTLGLNVVPLLGPLLIVGIGATYGWRHAFWVAGIPGLILALIIWRVVRNPAHEPDQSAPKGSVGPLLKLRNIRVNLILATLLMSCVIGINGFLPLYLVRVLGLSDGMMGLVMTMIAAAMVLYGFVGPMLSDRIGRKTVIIAFFLVSVPGYLMLIYSGGALPLILAGGMIGAAFTGASILIMAAIPGESAPPHLAATAMGFVAGTGEMLGAGLMPVGVGWLADQVGLGIVPWLFIVAATLVCLVTLGLTETAPGRLARTGTKPATA